MKTTRTSSTRELAEVTDQQNASQAIPSSRFQNRCRKEKLALHDFGCLWVKVEESKGKPVRISGGEVKDLPEKVTTDHELVLIDLGDLDPLLINS